MEDPTPPRPGRVVALCAEHHDKADHRAFTDDQLREFKRVGRDRSSDLGARFDWMREQVVAIVGGNVYFETRVPLQVRDQPIISFGRDDDRRLLLNLYMLTTSGEPRMVIEDNFWIETGEPADLLCPPKGTLVEARYSNGDLLRVEFSETDSKEALLKKHPATAGLVDEHPDELDFPLALVEVHMRVMGPDGEPVLELGPEWTPCCQATSSLGARSATSAMWGYTSAERRLKVSTGVERSRAGPSP